jgi:hypothetical protein
VTKEIGIRMMRWIMLGLAWLGSQRPFCRYRNEIGSRRTAIALIGAAFLISLCFLVGFVVSDAWMSRQPMSLNSICSNVSELYRNRDEITNNERWRQRLEHLSDDCAIATYKYDLSSPTYGLTSVR